MRQCRELARLPKAKSLKSVNFRRTTPGSHIPLVTRNVPFSRDNVLDPTHPAASLSRSAHAAFPVFNSSALSVRVIPKALLSRPEKVWPDPPFSFAKVVPWRDQVKLTQSDAEHREDGHLNSRAVDMSIQFVHGKKLHKSATVRNMVSRKIKTAIGLVVTRDASPTPGPTNSHAKDGAAGSKLMFSNDETNHADWILPHWTYSVRAQLEVYRMPYSELVSFWRRALPSLKMQAITMEEKWRHSNQEGYRGGSRQPHVTNNNPQPDLLRRGRIRPEAAWRLDATDDVDLQRASVDAVDEKQTEIEIKNVSKEEWDQEDDSIDEQLVGNSGRNANILHRALLSRPSITRRSTQCGLQASEADGTPPQFSVPTNGSLEPEDRGSKTITTLDSSARDETIPRLFFPNASIPPAASDGKTQTLQREDTPPSAAEVRDEEKVPKIKSRSNSTDLLYQKKPIFSSPHEHKSKPW